MDFQEFDVFSIRILRGHRYQDRTKKFLDILIWLHEKVLKDTVAAGEIF